MSVRVCVCVCVCVCMYLKRPFPFILVRQHTEGICLFVCFFLSFLSLNRNLSTYLF